MTPNNKEELILDHCERWQMSPGCGGNIYWKNMFSLWSWRIDLPLTLPKDFLPLFPSDRWVFRKPQKILFISDKWELHFQVTLHQKWMNLFFYTGLSFSSLKFCFISYVHNKIQCLNVSNKILPWCTQRLRFYKNEVVSSLADKTFLKMPF